MTSIRAFFPALLLAANIGCSSGSGFPECLDRNAVGKSGATADKVILTQACSAAIKTVMPENSGLLLDCLDKVSVGKAGTAAEKGALTAACAAAVRQTGDNAGEFVKCLDKNKTGTGLTTADNVQIITTCAASATQPALGL